MANRIFTGADQSAAINAGYANFTPIMVQRSEPTPSVCPYGNWQLREWWLFGFHFAERAHWGDLVLHLSDTVQRINRDREFLNDKIYELLATPGKKEPFSVNLSKKERKARSKLLASKHRQRKQ